MVVGAPDRFLSKLVPRAKWRGLTQRRGRCQDRLAHNAGREMTRPAAKGTAGCVVARRASPNGLPPPLRGRVGVGGYGTELSPHPPPQPSPARGEGAKVSIASA